MLCVQSFYLCKCETFLDMNVKQSVEYYLLHDNILFLWYKCFLMLVTYKHALQ